MYIQTFAVRACGLIAYTISKHIPNGIKWLENNYSFEKSELSVERILVVDTIELLAEHGIYCLPCSGTNYTIYPLPWQLRIHIDL